jgi:hypothetical protein
MSSYVSRVVTNMLGKSLFRSRDCTTHSGPHPVHPPIRTHHRPTAPFGLWLDPLVRSAVVRFRSSPDRPTNHRNTVTTDRIEGVSRSCRFPSGDAGSLVAVSRRRGPHRARHPDCRPHFRRGLRRLAGSRLETAAACRRGRTELRRSVSVTVPGAGEPGHTLSRFPNRSGGRRCSVACSKL